MGLQLRQIKQREGLMRDDLNVDLAGFRVTGEDRVGAENVGRHTAAQAPPVVRAVREPAPVRQRNGALWAVCASLLMALLGLGYWSHQQQTLLQQQLVATQESFARISEAAAGQLQDISGKVLATESSLTEVEQARLLQISQLEDQVQQLLAAVQTQERALQEQQQGLLANQQDVQQVQQASSALAERLAERLAELAPLGGLIDAVAQQQQRQQQSLTALQQQAEQAGETRAVLRSELDQANQQLEQLEQLTALQQQLAQQDIRLARQSGQLQALLEASSAPSVEQQRLESVDEALRSIDSFRVQTNRTLSTLQTQIGNLQQQLNQR